MVNGYVTWRFLIASIRGCTNCLLNTNFAPTFIIGLVYADIELTNWYDLENARRYIIGEDEVKKMTVSMLVDAGAFMFNINETIQEILQLPFVQRRKGQTADGSITEYDVAGPVRVEFEGRISTCNAMVLTGENKPLPGAIPMEEMPA